MYFYLNLFIALFSISVGLLSYLHINEIGLSFASPPALSNFPQCSKEDYSLFQDQLSSYPPYYKELSDKQKEHDLNKISGMEIQNLTIGIDIAGYKELKGECAFRQTYQEAREKFLEVAKKFPNAIHTPYEIVEGLYTDVVEIPGESDYFLISTSGVHGPEGYAGSASQISLLEVLANSDEMKTFYAKGTEEVETDILRKKVPTLLFIHAVNPYGFANNRRVNEDNIDINRNFLLNVDFSRARNRDPNFAGYLNLDFMINPEKMPTKIQFLNDLYGYLKSVYAIGRYGLGYCKRAIVAGNYFRKSGLGFGGFKRSKSVETMIQISEKYNLPAAKKLFLLDIHTGLGPSGTDTLALLSADSESEFQEYINRVFPLEKDGDKIVGGDKATDKKGSAMSGYELTIGTMKGFCEKWVAPNKSKNEAVCLTQEFGTVSVVEVGKAQIEENWAFHHGTEKDKALYGQRLKGVFYVETKEWMRNVAHRGVALWLEAFYEF